MHDPLVDRRGEPYSAVTVNGWRSIGKSIRLARDYLGWTQSRLARGAGVHQSTISRLETGQLTGLRWTRFAAIIGALGEAWPRPGTASFTGFPGWDRLR